MADRTPTEVRDSNQPPRAVEEAMAPTDIKPEGEKDDTEVILSKLITITICSNTTDIICNLVLNYFTIILVRVYRCLRLSQSLD